MNSNLNNNDSALKPLANVRVEQLPEKFRDVFDPAKPLTVKQFSPVSGALPYWAALCVFGLPSIIVCYEAIVSSKKDGVFSAEHFAQNFVWCIVPLIVLTTLALAAFRKQMHADAVDAGRLRLGLFLHPDALLVRTKKNSCYLLPRDFVKNVEIKSYLHARGTSAVKMIFHGADGYPYPSIIGINSFGIFDYLPVNTEINEAINSWKNGAVFTENQSTPILQLNLKAN